MKASDLKPGQFFEWDNVRLLAVRPRLNVPAFVAVNIHDNLFNVPSDSEVDAGVPQSWDDEPEGEPRCEVCRQPADGKTLDDVYLCERHFRRDTPAEVEQYCKEKEPTTLHPLEAERNAFRKHYAAQSPVDEDDTNGMPREPQLKGPSEAWLREMAEKEDGKCISVGGLAVKLGLHKKPEHPVPQPDPDGWIAWEGGTCPVDGKQRVRVRFRIGREDCDDCAWSWRWTHNCGDSNYDIVAYRLVQTAPVTDWVEVVTR